MGSRADAGVFDPAKTACRVVTMQMIIVMLWLSWTGGSVDVM